MFFDDSRIVIDESLETAEYPGKECRYRLTLAREGRAACIAPRLVLRVSFDHCVSSVCRRDSGSGREGRGWLERL